MRKILCAGALRTALTTAVLAMAVFVAFSSPGLAAPNRKGSTAKLSVAPTPVPLGTTYIVNGTGFPAGSSIAVTLARHCEDGITYSELVWMGMADASGSWSFARGTNWCRGTYVATGYQGRHGASASVSFPVQ